MEGGGLQLTMENNLNRPNSENSRGKTVVTSAPAHSQAWVFELSWVSTHMQPLSLNPPFSEEATPEQKCRQMGKAKNTSASRATGGILCKAAIMPWLSHSCTHTRMTFQTLLCACFSLDGRGCLSVELLIFSVFHILLFASHAAKQQRMEISSLSSGWSS